MLNLFILFFRMKVLLSLLFVGLVAGSEDYKMIKSWSMMKAGEHCWGSENFRLKTIKMKRAVAECSQTDAPELELPPFRFGTKQYHNTKLTL